MVLVCFGPGSVVYSLSCFDPFKYDDGNENPFDFHRNYTTFFFRNRIIFGLEFAFRLFFGA